jgi:hypothetical protein
VTALDLESALRNCRAALVAMTEANTAATERADRAEQRAAEAERAVAAMRPELENLVDLHDEGLINIGADNRSDIAAALSTPIGSGWLSPAEAADLREKVLDELALEIGFGDRPEGRSGVYRPENLAESIRDALHERDQEIERQSAYVDAWDEYFRAQKTIDQAGFMDNYTDAARARDRQAKAIAKARDAWERDTEPEDIAAPAAAHPTEEDPR